METFTRWVYYFLESLGLDLSYMTNLNRLIVLVLIAVLASDRLDLQERDCAVGA